jgi:hypothetical protein
MARSIMDCTDGMPSHALGGQGCALLEPATLQQALRSTFHLQVKRATIRHYYNKG